MTERPTDLLKKEHQNVLRKLDALDDAINRLHQKEAVAAPLRDLTAFFNTDFWVHFAKEEEALFPELEKFIPRDAGPIGVMLLEHDDLRATNQYIHRAVTDYLGDSDSAETRATIQKHASHFITVLRDHIYKEDNILFMMADMHLDKAQVSSVLRLFQGIEASGGKASSAARAS